MNIYADIILDHYRNPRGKLPLHTLRPPVQGLPSAPRLGLEERTLQGLERRAQGREAGEGVIIHSESNPACGDEITVGMIIRNGRVAALQWNGAGCAISQAAMSMLSEKIGKRPEGKIEAFMKKDMLALLCVPISPRRLKCALLGLHACKNALRKAKGQEILGWAQSVLGLVSSRLLPP